MSLSKSASHSAEDLLITKINNEFILDKLQKGDLIEFSRGLYSHWAVYVGKEQVIHLTAKDEDGNSISKKTKKAHILKESFWKAAGESKAFINHSLEKDKKNPHKPLSPEEIVEKAESMLGEVGYDLAFLNCEHFAKWCRYGIAQSEQAKKLLIGAGISTGLTGSAIGGTSSTIAAVVMTGVGFTLPVVAVVGAIAVAGGVVAGGVYFGVCGLVRAFGKHRDLSKKLEAESEKKKN